jgi:hypothetical protein
VERSTNVVQFTRNNQVLFWKKRKKERKRETASVLRECQRTMLCRHGMSARRVGEEREGERKIGCEIVCVCVEQIPLLVKTPPNRESIRGKTFHKCNERLCACTHV